jgi:hypothetical protein
VEDRDGNRISFFMDPVDPDEEAAG